MNSKKKFKNERGQSMVELAISLVFLLIIVAGVVDLGRVMFAWIAIRDATQEGAAYASVAREDPGDAMACADIISRIRTSSNSPVDFSDTVNVLIDVKIDDTDCSSANAADACLGAAVEVTITYDDYPLVTPFIGLLFARQSIDLSATTVDTILTPACQ